MSRPARARGLKHLALRITLYPAWVAPRAGAWIETLFIANGWEITVSRPARARGLKLYPIRTYSTAGLSRPARARGLKPRLVRPRRLILQVAPRAGAWIETNKNPR